MNLTIPVTYCQVHLNLLSLLLVAKQQISYSVLHKGVWVGKHRLLVEGLGHLGGPKSLGRFALRVLSACASSGSSSMAPHGRPDSTTMQGVARNS